jgi:peptidoglycan hydrolase-like protein with peptidoglycan-binding domain
MRVVQNRVLPKQKAVVSEDLGRLDRRTQDGERLMRGDNGAAVESLQRQLRLAGAYGGKVDGKFGGGTEVAVKRFQKARGLRVTGKVNGSTARALRANTLFMEDRFETVAHRGQRGKDVLGAERRLAALGFGVGKVDGVFDGKTARAVRAFRKDHSSLENDRGALDQQVYAQLQSTFQAQVGTVNAKERGRNTRQAERRLDRLGYDVGRIDGQATATTAASVAKFQRKHGLEVTGTLTGKTQRAIKKADREARGINTVKEANQFMVTQWGPNRFNNAGAKYGYQDCAPTSAVMAASAVGAIKDPTPAGASRAIDRMRDLQRGRNTHYSDSTSPDELVRGLRKSGANVKEVHGFAAIDRALKEGNTLVANGKPWVAWGRRLQSQGKYLNRSDPGHHSVAVLGRTNKGKYLVADPLNKNGVMAVSRQALSRFLTDGSNRTFAVSRRG